MLQFATFDQLHYERWMLRMPILKQGNWGMWHPAILLLHSCVELTPQDKHIHLFTAKQAFAYMHAQEQALVNTCKCHHMNKHAPSHTPGNTGLHRKQRELGL